MKKLVLSLFVLVLYYDGISQVFEYKVEGFKKNCIVDLDSLTFRWVGECSHYLDKDYNSSDLHEGVYAVWFNKIKNYEIHLFAMPGNSYERCQLWEFEKLHKMTLVKTIKPYTSD